MHFSARHVVADQQSTRSKTGRAQPWRRWRTLRRKHRRRKQRKLGLRRGKAICCSLAALADTMPQLATTACMCIAGLGLYSFSSLYIVPIDCIFHKTHCYTVYSTVCLIGRVQATFLNNEKYYFEFEFGVSFGLHRIINVIVLITRTQSG